MKVVAGEVMTIFEIPTFKPGQRVRVLGGKCEWCCPFCGDQPQPTKDDQDCFGTVLGEAPRARCGVCDALILNPPGWYTIRPDRFPGMEGTAPWTRLEAIE